MFRGWTDEPVAPTRGRRRRLALIAALTAVALVAVGGLAWLVAGRGGEEGRIRPVHSDAYAAPVDLPAATAYVRSRVLPSGDLEVTHWIHTGDPVDSLTVRTPQTLGLVTGSVTMSDVVLATDGTPYPTVSIGEGRAGLRTFRFPPASALYLRYRLSGVVDVTGPGDRALARITSQDVSTGGEVTRSTRTVVGARVLAMACTTGPPDATAAPCGSRDGGVWTVSLGRGKQGSRVMAQLDLS